MEMIRHFYVDTVSKSPLYKTPPESFWNLIKETVQELSQRFPDWPRLIQAETINKLIVAHSLLSPNQWNERFTHYKKIALRFPRSSSTLWKTITLGVCSPEIEKAYLESLPSPSRDNDEINPSTTSAPQKIGPELSPKPKKKPLPKRGQLWKLNRRWDLLRPSDRKIFLELARRTQQAKKPFAFPWCQAGIRSLEKFTGYSEPQVRRSIHRLQNYSLIKRIVRGHTGKGASKYYVFLTPKMSGAFYWQQLQRKKHPTQKNRPHRTR